MDYNLIYGKIDKVTGLIRSWGLILYGCFAANVSFVEELVKDNATVVYDESYMFLALIPTIIIFVLIYDRQRKWFLFRGMLIVRTIFIFFSVLLPSVVVSGLMLNFYYDYYFIFSLEGFKGVYVSFIRAILSLIVLSGLFFSIFVRNYNVPGLPDNDFIKYQSNVKKGIIGLKMNGFVNNNIDDYELFVDEFTDFYNLLNDYDKYVDDIYIKNEYEELYKDFKVFDKILKKYDRSGEYQRLGVYDKAVSGNVGESNDLGFVFKKINSYKI